MWKLYKEQKQKAKNQLRGKEAHHKVVIGFFEGQISWLGQSNGRARRQSWRPLLPSTAAMLIAPV